MPHVRAKPTSATYQVEANNCNMSGQSYRVQHVRAKFIATCQGKANKYNMSGHRLAAQLTDATFLGKTNKGNISG